MIGWCSQWTMDKTQIWCRIDENFSTIGCHILVSLSDYRPCKAQYPLNPELIEGITPLFGYSAVSRLTMSYSYLPSKIDSTGKSTSNLLICLRFKSSEWRCSCQSTGGSVSPHTILSQVPHESKYFSVVDVANAFFSIPSPALSNLVPRAKS